MVNRCDIEEVNRSHLERREQFRLAAAYVGDEMAGIAFVRTIVLFGSVASPPVKDVPRFRSFRRAGIEVWHECKDVDLAVWVSDLSNLRQLQLARSRAVNRLFAERDIGVAHHQIDVFLLEPDTNRYLGRLCTFGACPKGKPECLAPGCGAHRFLQQHQGFTLDENALLRERTVALYDVDRPDVAGFNRDDSTL